MFILLNNIVVNLDTVSQIEKVRLEGRFWLRFKFIGLDCREYICDSEKEMNETFDKIKRVLGENERLYQIEL